MPTREARNRRRDLTQGVSGLLERGPALAAIEELLDPSVDGDGALLIAGHPGLGKTRLFGVALDRARERGLLVLRAAGSELEQNVAFGVAGQLLRGLLAGVPEDDRAALLCDAPAGVSALYGAGPALDPAGVEDGLAISHGLLVVLAAACETRTVLVAIDDLHWCDESSLRFVLYLLARLPELSVALLLTSRPLGAKGAELDSIAAHRAVRVLTLAPLGRAAVSELVGSALGGEHAEALPDVCLQATGGNPFYLHELLLVLAESPDASGEQLQAQASSLAPDNVIRSLRVRVGRLGGDAVALGRAVAILGDEVPLRTAAALADLELSEASTAAEALSGAHVLAAREPLSFAHPLIRAAIEDDIPAFERASRHLQAARLLASDGEGVERVAAHLLRGRAEGDRWAVEQLHAAATEARSRGAAASAVAYLERALAEPAAGELRARLLAELGSAEAALGLPAADEHLTLAARASDDPRVRAQIALAHGGALHAQGLAERAAATYRDGLDQLSETPPDEDARELRESLQTAWLLSATNVPSLQPEAVRISTELIERDGPLSQGQRLLLAQSMFAAYFAGQPASVVADLATRAWDQGRLLEHTTASSAAPLLVVAALCLAGELERSIEAADAAAADAGARGAPLAFATATYMHAMPRLWQGNIDGALADLEFARDARHYGWRQYARSADAEYCLCMIEKGELDRADAVLTVNTPLTEPYDGEDASLLYALAELRRAQAAPQEAYELALNVGQAIELTLPYLGYCPWRCSAAESALALGQRDRARELIDQELERLETTQIPHEQIRALRLAGICEGGNQGLAKLREAVELGEHHPPRLETVRALISLGSALRRDNQRAAARPPLERAFELTRRSGASVLRELARTELAATGARPRREALSGPESLTPSEHRIAQLAASGHSNREIATALFITPKTVEYHLRNCYTKLNIRTRRELARGLET
jgi:DNA-binding CsgD family transcriptional regulator